MKYEKVSKYLILIWVASLILIRGYNLIQENTIGHGGIDPLSILAPYLIMIGALLSGFYCFASFGNKRGFRMWVYNLPLMVLPILVPILLWFYAF